MEMNADDRELHRMEDELQTELIPGTEIMKDLNSHHFVKGDGSRVLVPQPSQDPHDPLNWSLFWKISAITCSTYVSFTQGMGPLSLAPMFPAYIEDFHCTLAQAVQFTGLAILILGFSNFFWVPLSTTFGRRFVYICSQTINIGAAIWRARAQSYGSFMGACILNGFAAGPAETIQPAVIADLFFLHDRGKWNTLYWVFYMGSLMVGPIISGAMAQRTGWRDFWWLYVAMLVLSLLMCIFLFPETKYHRLHPDEIARSSSNSSAHEKKDTAVDVTERSSNESMSKANNLQHEQTVPDAWLGRGHPSKAQWRLFQHPSHFRRSVFIDFFTPWKLFFFPIVQFSSFCVSWSASDFLVLNLTQSQVFAAPPYNISAQNIGFMNFAILIGALIGLATAGPFSDWVSMRATIKNNGIREPEMRLPAMIPYVLIMLLGNFILAFGYQYQWPWQAIVIIGYACSGIQVAGIPSITSTYAVDSYKPVAGSLFVSITVNKNLYGYGLSKYITPWTDPASPHPDYLKPIMTNTCLVFLWCLFGILFYYKGKTFRRWTRNSSVHKM